MQLFKLILYRPPVQGLMDWRRGASTLSGNHKAHSRLRFVLGFDVRRIDPRRTECLDSLATSALSTLFIRSAFTNPLLQALRAVMRKLVTSCKPQPSPRSRQKPRSLLTSTLFSRVLIIATTRKGIADNPVTTTGAQTCQTCQSGPRLGFSTKPAKIDAVHAGEAFSFRLGRRP